MGRQYKHLSEHDRIFIDILLKKRFSKSKIAQIIKVDVSTIYREIKRNITRYKISPYAFYNGRFAHGFYLARRQRNSKLAKDAKLRDYVHERLSFGWSPWQIEGRLKRENNGACLISHESIYRYIYNDNSIRNQFFKKLRRKHFNRIKRNSRKARYPRQYLIKHRPEIIKHREEFGHWECDLMMFKRGIKSNLITIRERSSRYLVAIKNENKKADTTAISIISTLKHIKNNVLSITFDQGSEFNKYTWIKDCLEADIFFCDPGSPEQKGAVENVNGVIRSDMPREMNLDSIPQKNVLKLVHEINNRPLKCLDYQTPREVFEENYIA